jgi:hypothetical protein
VNDKARPDDQSLSAASEARGAGWMRRGKQEASVMTKRTFSTSHPFFSTPTKRAFMGGACPLCVCRVGVGAQHPHARTTFVLRLGGVCRTLTSSSASSQLPSEPL